MKRRIRTIPSTGSSTISRKITAALEVAVAGVPDKVMGEAVKACVVVRPGESATEEEIKQCCAECLADYKVPKFVEFMESLPRNPAGKVSKTELRYVPAK